jgi:hypothetical protein
MHTSSEMPTALNVIQDFFDTESKCPKPERCEHCGSSLRFLDTEFWLYGTSRTWRISLPFCTICDLHDLNAVGPAI